jgi:uncharacterized protein YhaN
MRIDRLDLDRFGCFTGCSLDLSAPGTHVIVGHNAAGKITAMAAIRQLFFGISARSSHAFNHASRDHRIGALLRSDCGELLEIARVKRQADTLRDGSDNVLDESVFTRLIHGIDADVFARLFTAGHEEIASGGHKLLTSDGELGRALFSASRGSADINAVL